MARLHTYSENGDTAWDMPHESEIEWLSDATDKEAEENLRELEISDEILDEAWAAAQAVIDRHTKLTFVAAIEVERVPAELAEACRCGSRCVARACEPYCVRKGNVQACGHRKRCTRRACNPC